MKCDDFLRHATTGEAGTMATRLHAARCRRMCGSAQFLVEDSNRAGSYGATHRGPKTTLDVGRWKR